MDENNNSFTGPLLPLTLLTLAVALYFLSQLGSVRQSTQTMAWQDERADKLIDKLTESQATLTKSVEANNPLVAQSEQTQKQFSEIVKELDEIARGGDKDAETIIKGYGIKVNDTATPAPKTDPEKKNG